MDAAFGLLIKGYPYFLKKFREKKQDIIKSRLLLFTKVVAMRGEAAARLFYDEDKFIREGAMPKPVQKTLVGVGGVQGLDDAAHKKRKSLFMEVMREESLNVIESIFKHYWKEYMQQWQVRKNIVLFDEAEKVLCRTAFNWVGLPVTAEEVATRAGQLSALIDAPATVSLLHFKGRKRRRELEEWLSGLVTEARDQKMAISESSIVHKFISFRDEKGNALDARVVAVELLNLVRPIVALARYIIFAALALHEHPLYRIKLKGDEELYENFVHEVRRYYPFFPAMAARVRESFVHNGVKFKKGRLVLLDIYATNHDEDYWESPSSFSPERFKKWNGSAYNFIPQGGGSHYTGHRCAGEWVSVRLTKAALRLLNEEMDYVVLTNQDLKIDKARIPAIPRSRFKINVKQDVQSMLMM